MFTILICWKEISTLKFPREEKVGGGGGSSGGRGGGEGGGIESIGYLCYPVTFAAGFHLFLFLHLSRKKL